MITAEVSQTCREMKDAGHWSRIKTEVVKACNEIDRHMELESDQATSHQTKESNTLVNSVGKSTTSMGIPRTKPGGWSINVCVTAMDIKLST